ncbi:MAG TPA: peptidoglycan DD-metalloendopeptidase family protein [Steroidobacteraceae bacterium]|nr:peptidoglycan DD-metalloendopeptidase family protein [Steroidobacteraceae bacterium]
MSPETEFSLRALVRSRAARLRVGPLAVLAAAALGAWGWLEAQHPAVHGNPGQARSATTAPPTDGRERTASGATVPAASAARLAPGTNAAPAATGPATSAVVVGRNDTLDRIFRRLQLRLADLAALRVLPGIRADIDRLKPGETLTLVHRGAEVLGFSRRVSLAQTLDIEREASGFQARLLANPLETRTRTVTGSIDSSLFEAMESAGAHDQTTLALADIFAWDIDFLTDIQPGDAFTVTYEEVYEKGKYLQDGPILAARFVNHGREYLAVRYVAPDGRAGYYTPDGRSLHKAFLRAPLQFTRVSSPFNLHRRHPILNLIRAHKGVDYAAPIGTPVHAAGDGRIIFAGRKGGYGNLIEIDHSRGITTVYGHLSRFARDIRPGRRVEQGEVIAYVGMTGLATGPHLHYEYRVNGVYKNPQTVVLPDAVPIDAGLRADFAAKTSPLLGTLYPPEGPALVSR